MDSVPDSVPVSLRYSPLRLYNRGQSVLRIWRQLLGAFGALTFSVGNIAVGSVGVSIIDRGTPVSPSATASGYHAYIVHLESDSGLIRRINLYSAGYGLFGPMAQRWASSGSDGIYDLPSPQDDRSNLTPSSANFDSHFLRGYIDPGDPFGPPAEESLAAGTFAPVGTSIGGGMPTNTVDFGIGLSSPGGFVKGIIELPPAYYAVTEWDTAYFVVRTGDEALISGKFQVLTAGGTFDVSVPEPCQFLIMIALITQYRNHGWAARRYRAVA
jgi:hypothetical protein